MRKLLVRVLLAAVVTSTASPGVALNAGQQRVTRCHFTRRHQTPAQR